MLAKHCLVKLNKIKYLLKNWLLHSIIFNYTAHQITGKLLLCGRSYLRTELKPIHSGFKLLKVLFS